ncbi:hypothetical protein [Paraburkholderia xenovorans]|uniref:hypothetical protein n=1 Tax=Paraburkholderia xenovorans TaxID=36873 RepID=UPI0015C57306|nr:hypothetical protein [Paraburkholderia xenovorans]NPT36227.1 hypothetical protein [Paraburkholderia xenovorans]
MNKAAQVQYSAEKLLRNTLSDIDAISQEITSNIDALCSVTLMAMKTQAFWKTPDTLVQVLTLIAARAQDLGNTINAAAEDHGCNWIDQAGRDNETIMRDAIRAAQTEACNG